METKEQLLADLANKIEEITYATGEIVSQQNKAIEQLQNTLHNNQNQLALNLLNFSSEIGKHGLRNQATHLEEIIVNNLLNNAPYDAKQAFYTHRPMFSERHQMAMFIYEHLSEIKANVEKQRVNRYSQEKLEKTKVFTYWDSEENLPKIVEICRESLKRFINLEKFELVILNKNNYKDWTDFRLENINAEISQAHFTDLLRVKLLEKWGGFWLDATCLLTQDFYRATQAIQEQEHFMFSYVKSRVGTWFMYSKQNNYVISMISETIQLWWKEKKYLTNYFMLHDVIEMLYWIDHEYKKQWDINQKMHPRGALAIFNTYNKVCTNDIFSSMINHSFIHKLTYKYNKEKIIKDSSLERILNKSLDKIAQARILDFNTKRFNEKIFIFSRKDGSYSRKMRLKENGKIENIDNNGHDNEYSWEVKDDILLFKNKSGNITGVFNELLMNNGKNYLYGYFKPKIDIQFKLSEV